MTKIYLTNLGKYNEGILMGEWVTLPFTGEELETAKKTIGINKYYEEYFISDYETDIEGLNITEYEDLESLNENIAAYEDLDESEKEAVQAYLIYGEDLKSAIQQTEEGNYYIYDGCYDMEDVAYQVIEENGLLNDVDDTIADYFDYEAYGRDLDINGTFIPVGNDYVELN